MKKNYCLFLGIMFMATPLLKAQVNIVLDTDSVYVTEPASQFGINLPSHITNNSGGTVTIRWTRVVEQKPQEWGVNFCDKNLCYLGSVASKTFELANGEEGALKPVFFSNEVPGMGVFRLYLQSETPGVVWADTAVFVAVATEVVGTMETELVHDIALFPNPATDMLNVATTDANVLGQWRITDATGKVYSSQKVEAITGQIPVAHLPAGLYILNILSPDGRCSAGKRFVMQR